MKVAGLSRAIFAVFATVGRADARCQCKAGGPENESSAARNRMINAIEV